MLVSNCCGAENRLFGEFGSDYKDAEICPLCKEHCAFITEESYDTIVAYVVDTNFTEIKEFSQEDLHGKMRDFFRQKH